MKNGSISPNPGMPVSGDASSTTKSAIEAGATITITGNQTQDLSKLSRDTGNSLNVLGKIFDKKTVQEQQELAKVFGEEAFKAVGDLALSEYKKALKNRDNATTAEEKAYYQNQMNQWDEGGSNKILLHALAGGIMSDLGGNGFSSGAVSAGVNEAVQGELAKIKDPGLHQLASALIGGVAAKIVGGNSQVGASVTTSATKNNFLSHWQKQQRAKAEADGDWEKVAYWDRVDETQETILNYFGISADFINSSSSAQNTLSTLTTNVMSLQDSGIDPIAVLTNLDKAGKMLDNVKYGALIAAGIEFANLSYSIKGAGKAIEVPGRVQSRINLRNGSASEGAGWEHVVDRHFNPSKNASQFTVTQDELKGILQSETVINTPVTRTLESADGIRYVREVNLNQTIGIDKFSGQSTSIMTVLTDKFGNLVTATPGVIK